MTEQEQEPAPAEEQSPEEWLAERTKETRLMGRVSKRELANRMQAGEPPDPSLLLSFDRLETKLANRARIERVRQLTRTRRGPAG
jgi:hypothetical protein